MDPEHIMLALSLVTLMTLISTLAAASFIFSKFWRQSNIKKSMSSQVSEEFFVTARNAGNTWLLTCSWYSGLSGAWIIPTSASYGYTYGIFGMLYFTLTAAVEPLITAIASRFVYATIPKDCSLPASIRCRYGRTLELYTLAFMALSELTCLSMEYTALASLFSEVLGLPRYIILVTYGCFSLLYILVGGALVGLFTAQFHTVLGSLGFAALLCYFVTVASPYPSPSSSSLVFFGPTPSATFATIYGSAYSNFIFALFYCNFWQKTVCSRNKATTIRSAIYGSAIFFCVSTLFGFTGVVAAWKDLHTTSANPYSGSSYLLYLDPIIGRSASIYSILRPFQYWFGIAFLAFAAISSKAAVECWLNGVLCGVYGSLRLSSRRLLSARVIVIALNSLCLYTASLELSLFGVYTVANMFCATLVFPLFLSLCVPTLARLSTSTIIISSSVSGLLACSAYGIATIAQHPPAPNLPPHTLLKLGLQLAFYANNFAWQFILLSLGVPLVVYSLLMLSRARQKQHLLQWWRMPSNAAAATYSLRPPVLQTHKSRPCAVTGPLGL